MTFGHPLTLRYRAAPGRTTSIGGGVGGDPREAGGELRGSARSSPCVDRLGFLTPWEPSIKKLGEKGSGLGKLREFFTGHWPIAPLVNSYIKPTVSITRKRVAYQKPNKDVSYKTVA